MHSAMSTAAMDLYHDDTTMNSAACIVAKNAKGK